MNILAIETSCDETSAAVVKDGTEALSNVVASQNEFHAKYGGIVPEIAARRHIENISPVIKEALEKANASFKDIDAVAVTFGPGLPGSLIVGLSAAKAISYALKKPLIGVNHLEGHIYANFLAEIRNPNLEIRTKSEIRNPKSEMTCQTTEFPFLSLIVSGGHTQLVLMEGHCKYKTLGRTRDDAAGEAYDKVARFLGLGYPGGPIIDNMAKLGDPSKVIFKRPMLEDGYDFSFSGIKTAVVYYLKKNNGIPAGIRVEDIAASFQKSVVETLAGKAVRAAIENGVKTVALAGGVAANSALRRLMKDECSRSGIECIIPPMELCTDNAAMIGCAAYYRLKNGFLSGLDLAIGSTARIG